jgi:hypothetical protein
MKYPKKERAMKTLLMSAALLLLLPSSVAQQVRPPYAPPPHETPQTSPEKQLPGQAPPDAAPGQVPPDAAPGQMPPDTQAPPAQQLSTADVQKQIQQKMGDEPMLSGSSIVVSVDDQSVTLQGVVDSERQHDLAMRVAQSYAGNRPVVDKIQVRQKS